MLLPISVKSQEYIFDIVKQNPRILPKWELIVPSVYSNDEWIKQLNGTTIPTSRVVIGGKAFYLGSVCKPHDCGGNYVVFFITVDGSDVYGMLRSKFLNVNDEYFGDPDQEGQRIMTKYIADHYRVPRDNPTHSAATPVPTQREANLNSSSVTLVPMQMEGGIYVVPVLINGTIPLDFIVDSGAADVTIPADVFSTLIRAGTVKATDFLGQKTYRLADGSTVPSQTFRIRSLKVGNKVLENVTGSVASANGSLLLGQSFLGRFKSWSVDNNKHALILE